jgi:hypothetical protein
MQIKFENNEIYLSHDIICFFENNCGAKPPSNKYINKMGEEPTNLQRALKEAGGRRHLTSS